jgi:hypothetical protein
MPGLHPSTLQSWWRVEIGANIDEIRQVWWFSPQCLKSPHELEIYMDLWDDWQFLSFGVHKST